jgi:hypothetical protein
MRYVDERDISRLKEIETNMKLLEGYEIKEVEYEYVSEIIDKINSVFK